MWAIAAVFTRLDAMEALGKTLAEANAGRFDPPPPPDGSRHLYGYYECKGGPVFLKLAINANGTSGRMEFGSSMVRYYPAGILEVTPVSLHADGLRIDPSAWVLQPAMEGRTPITLEGRLDASRGEYSGQVLGVQGCTSFALEPEPPKPNRTQNFDGLLFHVRSQRDHDLDAPRCRIYAEWLAEQTLLQFGDVRALSSAITDVDGMLRVLGKAPEHFRPGDSMTINTLAQICRQMLTESMDAADRTLASKVQDWVPSPLRASLNSAGGYEDWLIAEQVPLVTRKQQQALDDKLAEIAALPAQPQSLELADREREQTSRNTEGWLRLLSPPDRKHNSRHSFSTLGEGLNCASPKAWPGISLPCHRRTRRFEQLDGMLREHQQALQPYQARAGSAALQDAYEAAAAERAGLLWPGFLDEAEATLSDNAGAGYEAFGHLARFDDIGDRLQRHARPMDDLSQRHTAYRDRSRALSLDMVRRSEARLSEWVEQLPPSVAGRDALAAFTRKTFEADAVPAELSRLRTARRTANGKTHRTCRARTSPRPCSTGNGRMWPGRALTTWPTTRRRWNASKISALESYPKLGGRHVDRGLLHSHGAGFDRTGDEWGGRQSGGCRAGSALWAQRDLEQAGLRRRPMGQCRRGMHNRGGVQWCPAGDHDFLSRHLGCRHVAR
ncbi:hypothetical protein [Mesorhizobium onobrychidis]|uniref:Uncharacterized protein n=1 Tax=Mesorhizobium onobrychidis TaxID=2775404 RepID=A0ABY5QQM9_9HYPH|nr:hypothetical protein [Mesorhizobium onobrychidis]UVC13338.1 hypothetical protein IHQ72_21690 [Mesorhizobium onobrychidis]